MLKFIRNWTLPLAMLAGTLAYLLFAKLPFLAPAKPMVNAFVSFITPWLIFAQLLLTFCKIDFHIPANERIIAYRLQLGDIWNCDVDTDFHFRVRIGGFWFEKCGEGPIHLCSNQEVTEPWVTSPCLIYDSDILYFRVKEKI